MQYMEIKIPSQLAKSVFYYPLIEILHIYMYSIINGKSTSDQNTPLKLDFTIKYIDFMGPRLDIFKCI